MTALLEICVDTPEGLIVATRYGADRIELCASLGVGGLTPNLGLMRMAAATGCPTRAMIRPRQGDFIYTEAEASVMLHDIDAVAMMGLEGVVIGCNHANGALDVALLERLARHARALSLKLTLHRSFDLVPDQLEALAIVQSLAIDAVLTSGGADTAMAGTEAISRLVAASALPGGGATEIIAGVGVTADTVSDIIRLTGVKAVHASCSRVEPSPDTDAVRFGFADPDLRQTDPRLVTLLSNAVRRAPTAAAAGR